MRTVLTFDFKNESMSSAIAVPPAQVELVGNARHRYSKKKLNIAEVAHADEVQFVHFAEKADSS